jgi:hypothetical protein
MHQRLSSKATLLTLGLTLAGAPALHAQEASPAPVEVAAPSPASVEPVAAPEPPKPAVVVPEPAAPPAPAPKSWFERAPLTATVGQGPGRWSATLYGFIEADFMFDTTRSYGDAMGRSLVARDDTYDGRTGRTQFSMRNTRLGLGFEAPAWGAIKPSAVLEVDFFGHQGEPPEASEQNYFVNPTLRLRHAYVKLANPYVDVLVGQTYDVFGWQNMFSPCSVQFLGLPNQLFSRNPQIRLSRTFNADGLLSVDVALAAVRPAQRDSEIPDANGGVRFSLNSWKGITTPGAVGTTALPLSIGLSGTYRQFKANAFAPPPVQGSNSVSGWGLSADILLPIIPAKDAFDRSNRLTLVGSFVTGTGIADLLTVDGGATFTPLPNPTQASPPLEYESNTDPGLVTFDLRTTLLHTIDWQAFRVGLQYYLPGGRVLFSANFTQAHSGNLSKLYMKGGAEIEQLVRLADTSRYADANLFWDVTPSVRVGLSGQYTTVTYLEDNQQKRQKPHNIRGMAQTVFVF